MLVSQYHRGGAKCGCAWSLPELSSALSENREFGRIKSKKKKRKKTDKKPIKNRNKQENTGENMKKLKTNDKRNGGGRPRRCPEKPP